MLQSRRLQVQFLMKSSNFFNCPNRTSCTIALELDQPLMEWGKRSLPGCKGRLACEADNLTISEPNV
jgi:hypothetical protein